MSILVCSGYGVTRCNWFTKTIYLVTSIVFIDEVI